MPQALSTSPLRGALDCLCAGLTFCPSNRRGLCSTIVRLSGVLQRRTRHLLFFSYFVGSLPFRPEFLAHLSFVPDVSAMPSLVELSKTSAVFFVFSFSESYRAIPLATVY